MNAAISAAEAGRQWPWALELLRVSKQRLKPTAHTYNSATSACEKASEWQRALALLWELKLQGPQTDSLLHSYGAAILAAVSAQPSQWQVAFSLLSEMTVQKITPQLATYALLLMECEMRGLAHAECSLLCALPEALKASLQAATGTDSGTDTREDVSPLVLQAAAQRLLLAGDAQGCTELLHQLDSQWTPIAEVLWQRAGNAPHQPGIQPSFAAKALEGLRAGRAKELRLCRHVFASASMGHAWSVCEASFADQTRIPQPGSVSSLSSSLSSVGLSL